MEDKTLLKAKYIGKSTPSVKNGNIYMVKKLYDKNGNEAPTLGVIDNDNEMFVYKKELFEIV